MLLNGQLTSQSHSTNSVENATSSILDEFPFSIDILMCVMAKIHVEMQVKW